MQPPLDPRRVESQLGPGSDTASWSARPITDRRHLHSTEKTRSRIESRRVSVVPRRARAPRAAMLCTGQIVCAEENSHLALDRWDGADVARARSGVVSGKYDEDCVARLGMAHTRRCRERCQENKSIRAARLTGARADATRRRRAARAPRASSRSACQFPNPSPPSRNTSAAPRRTRRGRFSDP